METVAKGEAFWSGVGIYRYLTTNGREEKRESYQSQLGERSAKPDFSP